MSLSILMLLEGQFPAMGGAERQLETMAAALVSLGHRVTIVVPRFDWAQPSGASRHRELDVWRIGYPPVRWVGSLLLMLRLAWLLFAWRGRYDAIHVHIAHNMGAVASVMGRLLGKPVVVKFSGWWEQEKGCLRPRGGPGAALARRMLQQATAIQAISTRIARDLQAVGFDPARLHWLPNGVKTARFEGITRPTQGNQPPTVVFVGRLVPEKGLDSLLKAWARARRSGWRLRLVGGGGEDGALRAQAAALGVGDSVDLPGPSDTVEAELATADIGILPSRFEGLSNTLLEYMAAGLPVIATRISGSEDLVIPGRNGWLCDVDDVDGFAAALGEAMDLTPEARLAIGDTARADVIAKASVPAVIAQLLPLYAGESR
ncbi:MAG: glycosyltransferase family 4 protein [Silanimonas sp.]